MSTVQQWQGESGYVNCLLTAFLEGTCHSLDLVSNKPLPPISQLAGNNHEVAEWVSTLSFDYSTLNARRVVLLLLVFAGFRWYSLFKKRGAIETVVADKNGKGISHRITVEKLKSEPGEFLIRLSR